MTGFETLLYKYEDNAKALISVLYKALGDKICEGSATFEEVGWRLSPLYFIGKVGQNMVFLSL